MRIAPLSSHSTTGARRTVVVPLAVALVLALPSPAFARAGWKLRLDRLTKGRAISVVVGDDHVLYTRRQHRQRIPASNQKILLSMALLDRFGADRRLRTALKVRPGALDGAVVKGNVWIVGRGDPTITASRYGSSFSFGPTRVMRFARRLKNLGIERIEGRVVGAVAYFDHDWWAPGWKSYFPSRYIPLPTALTLNGNVARGRHVTDPERRAARALTNRLERIGVDVVGAPVAGTPPAGLETLAYVDSAPFAALMKELNRRSNNFFAEVLGKFLGARSYGVRGTIAKGARAIDAWASDHSVEVVAFDSSGLSYRNRVSARGLYRLLTFAERQTWGRALRVSFPAGGRGTLTDRLRGVTVRAKTGTLENVSALSGYVWLERTGAWGQFAILSRGMSKAEAAAIEDRIVTIVASRAR